MNRPTSTLAPTRRPVAIALALLATAAVALTACSDDASGPSQDRFQVSVSSIEPAEGFRPVDVRFRAGITPLVEGIALSSIAYRWDFGDGTRTEGSSEVIHSYDAAGTFVVTVTAEERSEGGDVIATAEASGEVRVFPQADLAVSSPTISPRSISTDEEMRLTFDLFNRAGEVPIPFDVGFYVAEPGAVDIAAPPTAQEITALLTEGTAFEFGRERLDRFDGNNSQLNLDLTDVTIGADVPSGTYEIFVYADPDGVVGEPDRANNFGLASGTYTYRNVTQDGPDLIVRDVDVRPARSNRLTSVTIDAVIENVGNESALLFEYAVFLSQGDTIIGDGDPRIGAGDVDNAAPGAPFVLDDEIFVLPEPATALGDYFVIIVADSADDVTETDESNNEGASAAIRVTDEPVPGTDIAPIAFRVEPTTTFLDGSVELIATIANQGSDSTEHQFFCRVFLSPDDDLDPNDDQLLDNLQIPAIDGGEEEEVSRVTIVPGFLNPGVYTPFIFCDPNFSVAESDEDNNLVAASDTLTITADPIVDLIVDEFTVEPTTVINEENVRVSVRVCNDGSNGSGPSILRVRISEDPEPDTTDTLLLQSRVPSIDPGLDSCVTVAADVPAICDTFNDTYNVFATVDATNVVPELDETNNVATLEEQLTIEGLICSCEPDEFDPDGSSPARPAFLTPGEHENLTMCEEAVDWYAIPLLRGETVRVVATFESRRGNLDMTLFGADRASILDESLGEGDREEVSAFVVPQRGDYLVKVFGRTEDDRNVYDLQVSVSSPDSGVDLTVLDVEVDNAEPVLGEEISLHFELINLGDESADPSLVRFFLSEDIEIDQVEDILLDQLSIPEVPGLGRVVRDIPITMPNEGDGGERYVGVVVDARDDVAELDESNNVGLSDQISLDSRCWDPLEPNNSAESARSLDVASGSPTAFAGLLVCSDNRDFYELCASDGEFLEVAVEFDNSVGDIDIRLTDERGTEVDRSEGITSEERVGVDFVSGDRCYGLEVYVAGRDREVPYEMTVDRGRAPDELICDNDGEPNNSIASAARLRDYLDEDLAVCPEGDEDYYGIPLTSGTELAVRLAPVEEGGTIPPQLRLSLWGPSSNFLANTVSATEVLRHRIALNGNHSIRVRASGAAPRNLTYRLIVEGIDGVDLVPDALVIDPEVAVAGDRVSYSVEVSNRRELTSDETTYRVYLSEDGLIDDTDRLLRTGTIPALDGLDAVTLTNKFFVPADIVEDAPYVVGVVLDPDDAVEEITERNNTITGDLFVRARCRGDALEPNDTFLGATLISEIGDDELGICGEDEDWFTTDAPPPAGTCFEITFDVANGDLDLFAYERDDDGLVLIDSSESLDAPVERICIDAPLDGDLFLQVLPFGPANNRYELRVISPG